jgi:hypothetical protein
MEIVIAGTGIIAITHPIPITVIGHVPWTGIAPIGRPVIVRVRKIIMTWAGVITIAHPIPVTVIQKIPGTGIATVWRSVAVRIRIVIMTRTSVTAITHPVSITVIIQVPGTGIASIGYPVVICILAIGKTLTLVTAVGYSVIVAIHHIWIARADIAGIPKGIHIGILLTRVVDHHAIIALIRPGIIVHIKIMGLRVIAVRSRAGPIHVDKAILVVITTVGLVVAIPILTIDPAIVVVVYPVVADLSRTKGVTTTVLHIVTVHMAVVVIIYSIIAVFYAATDERTRCIETQRVLASSDLCPHFNDNIVGLPIGTVKRHLIIVGGGFR